MTGLLLCVIPRLLIPPVVVADAAPSSSMPLGVVVVD
jgi:hypothetical protein